MFSFYTYQPKQSELDRLYSFFETVNMKRQDQDQSYNIFIHQEGRSMSCPFSELNTAGPESLNFFQPIELIDIPSIVPSWLIW